MMGKKGSFLDIFFLLAVLLVISISFMVVTSVWNSLLPQVRGKLDSTRAQNLMNTANRGFMAFDNMFAIVAIGGGLTMVVLAFVVDAHPIFAFMGIIIVVLALTVAPAISNVFGGLAASSGLVAASGTMPMMSQIMLHFPTFFLVFGLLLTIVMFGKIRGGGR